MHVPKNKECVHKLNEINKMVKSLHINDVKKEPSVSYAYQINRNSNLKLCYLKYCNYIMLIYIYN